jgi:hypothetical protein
MTMGVPMAMARVAACDARTGLRQARRSRDVRRERRSGSMLRVGPVRRAVVVCAAGDGQEEEDMDDGPKEVFRIEQLVDGEAEQVAVQKGAATGLLLVGGACVSLTAFLFARSFLGESGGANALNEAGLPLAIIWAVGGAIALGIISKAGVLEGDP